MTLKIIAAKGLRKGEDIVSFKYVYSYHVLITLAKVVKLLFWYHYLFKLLTTFLKVISP